MLSFCKTASDLQIIGGVDCRQQGCQAKVPSLKVEHLRTSRATSAADLIVEGALKTDGRSRLLIQTLKHSYRAQTDWIKVKMINTNFYCCSVHYVHRWCDVVCVYTISGSLAYADLVRVWDLDECSCLVFVLEVNVTWYLTLQIVWKPILIQYSANTGMMWNTEATSAKKMRIDFIMKQETSPVEEPNFQKDTYLQSQIQWFSFFFFYFRDFNKVKTFVVQKNNIGEAHY